MVRIHHHRLFLFGVITFIIGVVHLMFFYNETIKSYRKTNIGSIRLPIFHGKDYETKHVLGANTKLKFRKLENHMTTTQSTKSCRDSNCGGLKIINNKPGDLNPSVLLGRSDQPPVSESRFKFPPSSLKISVVKDNRDLERRYFSLRSKVVNTLPSKIELHNPDLCSLPDDQPPYLLTIVPTVAKNVNQRLAIRQTWASSSYNDSLWANITLQGTMRTLFILGTAEYTKEQMAMVKKEADQYGDMLLADFVDSYRNLSLKIAVGLAWTAQFCDGVNHVAKVDEDTFLFMPKLLSLLKRAEHLYSKFVLGFMHSNPTPFVLRKGRWKVDHELYPMATYPRYVYGHSYVVSGPAIKFLVAAFFRMPLVSNEDAFFTGILPVVSDVIRLSHRSFAYTLRHEKLCDVASGAFVSVTSCCNIQHRRIYQDIKDDKCSVEVLNELYEPNCRFSKKKTK